MTERQLPRQRFQNRVERARLSLAAHGLDALALSAGSDLSYLCGYEAMPLERLTLLVVGLTGPPRLLVPALEAPRVDPLDGYLELLPWEDGQDMMGAAVQAVRTVAGVRPALAVSDGMWASVLLSLQERLPAARFSAAGEVLRELRVLKSPDEVAALRKAAQAVDEITRTYPSMTWEGRTEAEVAKEIAGLLTDVGHEEVNFVIVASGPNGASPHHTAAGRRILRGDVIVVDIGGTMDGYCSDITRCVTVGDSGDEVRRAYDALRRAQESAVHSVTPGVPAEQIDAVARDLLTEEGYGAFFIHRTGHGIGLDEHEDPYIVAGNQVPLAPGMCFSIEPGVYFPGRFGLRLEDIVVVEEDGVSPLNTSSHDLIVV